MNSVIPRPENLAQCRHDVTQEVRSSAFLHTQVRLLQSTSTRFDFVCLTSRKCFDVSGLQRATAVLVSQLFGADQWFSRRINRSSGSNSFSIVAMSEFSSFSLLMSVKFQLLHLLWLVWERFGGAARERTATQVREVTKEH